MLDNESMFYHREKSKFDQLLSELGWTEECLLKEQETLIQCPIDSGHRFPVRSKHLQTCQLVKEGFSKDYLKELVECEQEKQLLHQSGISFTPTALSHLLHRSIPIKTNFPLNVEQTTVLFTPNERLTIAQAVHHEALRLGMVPSEPPAIMDNLSAQSQNSNLSEQLNEFAAVRDLKRRRTKYVTRTINKSFYDSAREMIDTKMELIRQINRYRTEPNKTPTKRSKHKHRSSSKKKHRSRHRSHKHHRHSKKQRTS